MKKFVLIVLALSFSAVGAQTKKKTKRKAKPKTTVAAKPVVEVEPVVEVPVEEMGSSIEDSPINSMSILNAKSPESFRKYRDLNLIKQGDSMVSNKITP